MEKQIREEERNRGKKTAQTKRKRRRKALISVLVSLVLVLALIFAIVASVLFFKVSEIKVKGTSNQYSNQEIVLASEIKINDSLLLINRKKIIENITEKLPYIKTVKIEKGLPSSVTISFVETKNELTISKNGEYYAADKDGKILSKLSSPLENLPIFILSDECDVEVGEKIEIENATLYDLFYKFIELTNEYNFKIDSVDITNMHDSYMNVENRLKVRIGSPNNFDMKMAHFNSMFLSMSEGAKGTVDLSSWTPKKQEAFFTASDF